MSWNSIQTLALEDLIGIWAGFNSDNIRTYELVIRQDFTYVLDNIKTNVQIPLVGHSSIHLHYVKAQHKCLLKLEGYENDHNGVCEITQILKDDFVLNLKGENIWFKK